MSEYRSLDYKIEDNRIIIYGDTFKNKEKIKSIGAKYNGKEKNWFITKNKKNLELVKKLCDSCNKDSSSNKRSNYIIDYSSDDLEESVDVGINEQKEDEFLRVKKELERFMLKSKSSESFDDSNEKQDDEISIVSKEDEDTDLDIDSLFKAPSEKFLKKFNKKEEQDEYQDRGIEADNSKDSNKEGTKGSDAISVSELMKNIDTIIRQLYQYPVWIYGEVQNLSIKPSGIFFELIEPKKNSSGTGVYSVKAIIWNSDISAIKIRDEIDLRNFLKDGIKISICTEVSFYKERSYISLIVKDIDPNYTKGQLALKKEKFRKELKQKGLYTKNKELTLSSFPLKIGLISSYKSRAYSDFTHQLFSQGYCGSILFYNARVQGEDSIKDIIKGIDVLNQKDVDLIVITRGGGALSDLMWFDSEGIVYSIVESNIPILSAIGHHDDESLSEEVSFHREKTPTAAADFIISVFNETDSRINECVHNIEKYFDRLYEECIEDINEKILELERATSYFFNTNEMRLSSLWSDLLHSVSEKIYSFESCIEKYRSKLINGGINFLNEARLNIAHLESDLLQKCFNKIYMSENIVEKYRSLIESGTTLFLNAKLQKLEELHYKLISKDPRPWLEKGYLNLVKKDPKTKEKTVIKSVDLVKLEDIIESYLIDGRLTMEVKDIKKNS